MKVFFWDDILNSHIDGSPCKDFFTSSALTIGGFDGPHVGHKALCERVLEYSKNYKKQAGVITFAHSPRMLKERGSYIGDISTLRLRLKTFEKWGFDFAVVIDFSKNFSKIEGATFLSILADRCAMQFLTVGEGFRCGYKGETDTAHIETFAKNNDITFVLAPLIHVSQHTISSSLVRQYIFSGKLEKCKGFLVGPFLLDVQSNLYEIEKSQEGLLLIMAKDVFTQVLPPNGEYNVSVLVKDSRKQFSSILYLDNINLRLNVPIEYENKQFDVIVFDLTS